MNLKNIAEKERIWRLPWFAATLLLLSIPFFALVIMWQDRKDYWDNLIELLKKRGGGRIDI